MQHRVSRSRKMADESYSFTTARTRLEEIVTQVRKKDTSLEKSLDLLEEGVRLANSCTELIDRADWAAAGSVSGEEAAAVEAGATESPDDPGEAPVDADDSGADVEAVDEIAPDDDAADADGPLRDQEAAAEER
jgi:exodeoxyribonuclease VII small subunit